MSVSKFLGGTVIAAPAVGGGGYVLYEELTKEKEVSSSSGQDVASREESGSAQNSEPQTEAPVAEVSQENKDGALTPKADVEDPVPSDAREAPQEPAVTVEGPQGGDVAQGEKAEPSSPVLGEATALISDTEDVGSSSDESRDESKSLVETDHQDRNEDASDTLNNGDLSAQKTEKADTEVTITAGDDSVTESDSQGSKSVEGAVLPSTDGETPQAGVVDSGATSNLPS